VERRLQISRESTSRHFKSEPSDFNRVVRGGLDRGHSWTMDL
jgi:hypothetical protein